MNLIHADCLDAMAAMEAESIDAIVTDPPYGLEFMGKGWDKLGATTEVASEGADVSHPFRDGTRRVRFGSSAKSMQDWHEAWAREAFRIAKPGAHLLAFGGTRTVHRLAAAIEDAGWEIRDMLVWGYASGFPKSLDVSKAIDKAAGAIPTVTGPHPTNTCPGGEWCRCVTDGRSFSPTKHPAATAPATPDAEKWNGWGTALKPAWEPIVMARKPLRGTVAANVLRHGTGALNIDGTRIGTNGEELQSSSSKLSKYRGNVYFDSSTINVPSEQSPLGRWPSNVILTDPIFDGGVEGVVGGGEQTSVLRGPNAGRNGGEKFPNGIYNEGMDVQGYPPGTTYGDSGTYSRFFLIPKSARAEREPVLGGLAGLDIDEREHAFDSFNTNVGNTIAERRRNSHPTVKPLDLMRHLVRLVTPPGGTVLDPFLGSGTTALACEMEGFPWIGVEKEAEYIAITEARLNGTQRGLGI